MEKVVLVSTSLLFSRTFLQKSEILSSIRKRIPENDPLEQPKRC